MAFERGLRTFTGLLGFDGVAAAYMEELGF